LRAGLVTSASVRGVAPQKIRNQTGHASALTMSVYIRDAERWAGNAAIVALNPRDQE
jgi:hypothetical protein